MALPYQQPGSPAVAPLPRQLTGLPQAFLAGDWSGAAIAVASGLGAMLGLALLAGLLGDTSTGSTGGSQLIGSIAILVAMAAGGTLRASAGDLGLDADVSFRPLGVTFLGFALIAILFARRLRRRGSPTALQVGLQAARLAAVLMAGLLVVGLLSRVGTESSLKIDVVSTMFFGVLTLAIALIPTVILSLPGILPPRVEHYRVRLIGPLRAVLVLTVTTCAATLVVMVLFALSWTSGASDGAELGAYWRGVIAALLLLLPNVAGAGLLFGVGVPATGSLAGSFGIASTSSGGTVSILDAVGEDGRYWIWPLVLVILIMIAGVVSARRSPIGPTGRPMIVWFAVVLSLSLFVLSLSLSASAGAAGALIFSGSVGFDYLLTIVFGAAAGLIGGLVGAAVVRRGAAQAPIAPYPSG